MKVSVITVNYNQTEVTKEFLTSLVMQDFRDMEIIVVDNGSVIDPTTIFRFQFPWVRTIRSEQNLGFAGGNNLGINEARGEYLFFISNDTEVPKGTIADLVQVLDHDSNVAAVNPIMVHRKSGRVQFAGYTEINKWTAENQSVPPGNLQLTQEVRDTPYVHSAAMMVRSSLLHEIGPMPEVYFLYYEALEWSVKMKQCGHSMRVSQRSCITHQESISTGKSSPQKTYFQTRNRILFMRRNFKNEKWMFFLFFSIFSFPKNVLQMTFRGEWKLLSAFVKGVLWNFQNATDSRYLGFGFDSRIPGRLR